MKEPTCFWCHEPLGRFYANIQVGSTLQPMHQTMFRDCVNEYHKWLKTQPRLRLASAVDHEKPFLS